ncbi:MAG: hypothetical protein IPM29_11585 [Planctomycetes bacterium]|nr:hypothetical protein [Planctomycetota bacterium]
MLEAIAKEPERRYDSATALDMGLGRYLEHEPVLAGPPSAGHRLRELARKYGGQLAAAVVGAFDLFAQGVPLGATGELLPSQAYVVACRP